MQKNIFIFDVESISLHGEAFAFAAVVFSPTGKIIDKLELVATDPMQKASAWVRINVIPALELFNTVTTGKELRQAFYEFYQKHKQYSIIVADCAFPVETNFLSAVAADDLEKREFEMPYPLYDIANFVHVDIVRSSIVNKPLRKHNPYDDCLASYYALTLQKVKFQQFCSSLFNKK